MAATTRQASSPAARAGVTAIDAMGAAKPSASAKAERLAPNPNFAVSLSNCTSSPEAKADASNSSQAAEDLARYGERIAEPRLPLSAQIEAYPYGQGNRAFRRVNMAMLRAVVCQ
jgi:hypothetical protein